VRALGREDFWRSAKRVLTDAPTKRGMGQERAKMTRFPYLQQNDREVSKSDAQYFSSVTRKRFVAGINCSTVPIFPLCSVADWRPLHTRKRYKKPTKQFLPVERAMPSCIVHCSNKKSKHQKHAGTQFKIFAPTPCPLKRQFGVADDILTTFFHRWFTKNAQSRISFKIQKARLRKEKNTRSIGTILISRRRSLVFKIEKSILPRRGVQLLAHLLVARLRLLLRAAKRAFFCDCSSSSDDARANKECDRSCWPTVRALDFGIFRETANRTLDLLVGSNDLPSCALPASLQQHQPHHQQSSTSLIQQQSSSSSCRTWLPWSPPPFAIASWRTWTRSCSAKRKPAPI